MASSYGNGSQDDDVLTLLPDGHQFVMSMPYTGSETNGVLVLVIVSSISACAVIGLLLAIAVSAFNTRHSKSRSLFVRSHVAAYFISLLLCEVAQTVGSIMNIRWVTAHAVSYESYCTVQGVVKHISDVGTAYWSTIIALNTFWILFLQWKLRFYVLLSALLGGWATIGAIISAGPGALQRSETGPFYAISGYWCWISDEYPSERITLDYMIMFISAGLCFVMYTLVFLRLRGNILVHGWRLTFRFRRDTLSDAPRSVDTHVINIAKGMLLYPVAYTILLLPIAICRFADWTGHEVPFAVTIFSDSIFLLSGFVNVTLFLTTRRVLPIHSVIPRSVSRLFGNQMTVDTRASTYTTSSSYTSSSYRSDVDVEKSSRMLSYDESVLPRPDAPLSALATPYTANNAFVIGSVQSPEPYEDITRMPQAHYGPTRAPIPGRELDIDISSVRYSYDGGASPPYVGSPDTPARSRPRAEPSPASLQAHPRPSGAPSAGGR